MWSLWILPKFSAIAKNLLDREGSFCLLVVGIPLGFMKSTVRLKVYLPAPPKIRKEQKALMKDCIVEAKYFAFSCKKKIHLYRFECDCILDRHLLYLNIIGNICVTV